jgi:hypothetical protein
MKSTANGTLDGEERLTETVITFPRPFALSLSVGSLEIATLISEL